MARVFRLKMDLSLFKKEFCSVYMFLLTFFNAVVNTHMTVGDNSHAFIQANNNDVRLMGVQDGLEVLMQQGVHISNLHGDLRFDDDAFATSTYLKFVPPQLNFKERPLGAPHQEKVTLVNTNPNRSIHLTSISANTLHFHSSFFQDKTIPPKGNTTFSVVLLARVEGFLSSSLYVDSSEGLFRYHVTGIGIESPYRLRPVCGLRLPLNAVFQPLVWLHNPHSHPIQIVEIYSSGQDVHLELPDGAQEGSKALWEIPPFFTKPVIRAKFEAITQANHTSYIRMKLKHTKEMLVVPVEVEVTEQGGLYPVESYIDFGMDGTGHPPRTIPLQLSNSLKRAVRIVGVGLANPNKAITIGFEPIRVPPTTDPITVANLTFDWKVAYQIRQASGHIWIKVRGNTNKLLIPYTATVHDGGLKFNPTATQFLTMDLSQLPKPIVITNQYHIPLAINNATLMQDAAKVFQIKGFEQKVLPVGKSIDILSLALRGGCKESCVGTGIDSSLILNTNISDVVIPVRVYDGRFTVLFPHEGRLSDLLDLGLLSSGKAHTFRFGLLNHNAVPIELRSIVPDLRSMRVVILGVFKGNTTAFKNSFLYGNFSEGLRIVPPNGIAVLQLRMTASTTDQAQFRTKFDVITLYQLFPIMVIASIATGSLEMIPKDLVLEDCFPGKICNHQLKVQSSFNRPMTAVGVTTVPFDPRLTFKGNPGGSDILPSTSNYIGELTWEPWRCGASCYLGLPLNSTGGSHWVYSNVLPPSLADADAILLKERYQRLVTLTNGGSSGHWENITLRLHTNELREQLFRARVRLTWPKLANTTKVIFPLTQVTNTTLLRLKLFNPASHLILVQLVMEWAYPQPKRLIDSFPSSFRPPCGRDCFQSSPKEFFIFQDFSDGEDPLGLLSTSLAPGESYEITIGFNPRNSGPVKSLLFIRNNLTVIEALELEGRAAYAQFKFGNRRPGAENPLMFEIVDKHLRDCYSVIDRKKYPSPNLTVKRSFTARNVGDLPIYVHGFSISGLECEGYGFAVLNCFPFLLLPNSTRKIDIAFTPDFTLSKVTRTLRLATTVGTDVNYTMVTTLPSFFLSSCATVLGRPSWEPLLYYSAVSFMLFLLFCVIAAAYFESDRIMKCAMLTMSRDRTATPLDLRQVGAGVLKELAANRKVDSDLLEGTDKYKMKDSSPIAVSDTPGWITGLCADDRQFEQPQKEPQNISKTEEIEKDVVPKQKKKLGKRNSDAEAQEVAAISKRKDKNTSNGWCNVFNRGNEKGKPKSPPQETPPPESAKLSKSGSDAKKDDGKKEEKEKRRGKMKRNKEAEEETSSNMTDSSNDAEKDVKEVKETKEEKKPKVIKPKSKDEFTEETKSVHSRTIWRMGVKPSKLSVVDSVSVWKTPEPETEPLRTIEISKSRGKNNNVRERKEKAIPRRINDTHPAFNDFPIPNTMDIPCPPPPPSCWEQRTFSNVVAKDTPLLYSNIVSSKPSPSHIFSDSKPEGSASLGPIGSNKPTSVWGSNAMAPQKQYGYPSASFMPLQPEPEPLLDADDALPLDPEDNWEDQHALMQMMHTNAQPTWKAETWSKSVWSNELNSQPTTGVPDQSWESLLRTSWTPQWNLPQSSSMLHSLQNQHQHEYPPGYGADASLFTPSPTQPIEDPIENGAQFDPFHSLGSIWSPKAPNTWTAPGTQ